LAITPGNDGEGPPDPDTGRWLMAAYTYTRKHHITGWDPEDREAWDNGGAAIARRNLIWSIICEHIGFSIWSLFSVMVLFMSPAYGISLDQKFVITATATLVGGCLRIPYTQATAKFGGRNWAIFSAVVLLIPTALVMMLMMNPAGSDSAGSCSSRR
jgi:NNP family nitrate/nitrite transporter-like MFS transporter